MSEEQKEKKPINYIKLPPDPRLSQRTGYELASRWGGSGLGRAAAAAQSRRDWVEKKEMKAIKRVSPARGATEKQRAYAMSLGVTLPEVCSVRKATKIIGRCLRTKNGPRKKKMIPKDRTGR